MRRLAPLALTIGLAACAEFPELDAAVPASVTTGPYPAILPLDGLLREPDAAPRANAPAATALSQRADALRARAARLRRQAVIDRRTRARLDAANQG